MDASDEEIDRLQEQLYRELIERTPSTDTTRVLDLTLVGRYYERIADHAVALAHCLAFRAGQEALSGTR